MMKTAHVLYGFGHLSARSCAGFTALLWMALVWPSKAAEFEYSAINGAITITRYTGYGGVVMIPDRIAGLPVTRIDHGAFYSSTNVTGVIIPDSVTSIGDGAFRQCTSLRSIAIPDSVTLIQENAFSQCYGLTSVTIGNGVTYIGPYAFYYCASLANVAIPDSVTSLGTVAFWRCTNLVSVLIGKRVASIGIGAFYQCTSLGTITVDALNSRYSSRDGVLFNKDQTELIQYPLRKTDGEYTIPNTVARIGDYAFSLCKVLTNVTISDGVTAIGFGAFYHCNSLEKVTIGHSVITIGEEAFYRCERLASVAIPNSVTTVSDGAFRFCNGLTNLTIGNAVTTIGVMAFQGCSELTSVTIPTSVNSIAEWAFGSCPGVSGFYFQGNAPIVGGGVFYHDTNATVYYLPGTTGWGTTLDERPTAFWRLPKPVILNVGVQANAFGFTVSWATNIDVVVEATTNLFNPAWSPVGIQTLTNGWSPFSDLEWTNHPVRFYRLRAL